MKPFYPAPLLWGFFLLLFASTAVGFPLNSLYSTAVEDTFRILAIRVEFQPDSLSTTTGNGTFGDGIPEGSIVDPLPHDLIYFEDHLRFLRNYYFEISDGKVIIDTFAVYPRDTVGSYTLPEQMWVYNYNLSPQDLDTSLAHLFIDAWYSAAQDPEIHFEEWNTFIIFHAGIGQDFTISFDETPHDIPSAYFRLQDLQDALNDPFYQGIPNSDSTFYIQGGLLLPESERQSEVDMEIALNGTAALLFGQWIGLPALYNTNTGASGVGRFDLMDQGSGNFAGMVPSRPCAFTRVYAGWEQPQMITPSAVADTFLVNQTGFGDPLNPALHEIYRINLNENEYYLIENRSWDPDSLSYTYAYDNAGNVLKINEDYSVQKLNDDFGVIVRVDNYDFGIPGEGILIWHIDDEVIAERIDSNAVNNNLAHRGVELVEADGAEDIGQEYGFLDVGYGAEYGWAGDFFYRGNEAFLSANPNLGSVRFFDNSFPGTRTHDGSSTGLLIKNFSARDTVMEFSVQNTWAQQGFPRQLIESSGSLSPSALDFNEDDWVDLILTATPGGTLQAFDSLGIPEGFLSGNDTILVQLDSIITTPAVDVYPEGFTAIVPSRDGKVYRVDYSLAASSIVFLDNIFLNAPSVCVPVIHGSENDRIWVTGDNNGTVYAFDVNDDKLWKFAPFTGEGIIGLCLADTGSELSVFALTSDGSALLFNDQGDTLWTAKLPFNPAFAPICLLHQQNRLDLVAVGEGGEVAMFDNAGSMQPGFPFNCGMNVTAPPSAADFNADGYMELILIGANRILGVQVNGVLSPNWPIQIDNNRPIEPIVSPPVITNLTVGEQLHVIFGWSGGSVDARDNWCNKAESFPRSTGSQVTSAPLVIQLDEDSAPELIVLSEEGMLYAWNLEDLGGYDFQRRPWNGLQNGNRRQGIGKDSVEVIAAPQQALVTTKVYPWPNPAKDEVHIRFLLGQDGKITARIFDGAGDLVKELSCWAQAGLENDLTWNLADVSSGIYIARVEAETSAGTEKAFIKIAVVK